MSYLIGYLAILIVFGAVDVAWLSVMGAVLYRPVLGDVLLENVRLGPAFAFYLIYPFGVLVFAVTPALRTDSVPTALGWGLLFGAIAYGTYDLTNFATLRNWSLQITLLDMSYGAIVSGIMAGAGLLFMRFAIRSFGS